MAAAYYVLIILIVSSIYKEIVCEEQQLEALEKKLHMLEQKLLDMESKQHTESRKLHRTVNEVKEENLESMEHIRVTRAMCLDTIEKVDEVSEKLGKVDSKVDEVDSKVDKVKQQVDKLSTTVAFRARLSRDKFRPTSTSSPLPFDRVDLNTGNGYSGSNYKFTCPVSGLYFFSFSLHSSGLKRSTDAYLSWAYFYHDSHRLIGGANYIGDKDSPMSQQTAASAVIRCDAGDKVDVRAGNHRTNQFDCGKFPMCTFTGFLISTQ